MLLETNASTFVLFTSLLHHMGLQTCDGRIHACWLIKKCVKVINSIQVTPQKTELVFFTNIRKNISVRLITFYGKDKKQIRLDNKGQYCTATSKIYCVPKQQISKVDKSCGLLMSLIFVHISIDGYEKKMNLQHRQSKTILVYSYRVTPIKL